MVKYNIQIREKGKWVTKCVRTTPHGKKRALRRHSRKGKVTRAKRSLF